MPKTGPGRGGSSTASKTPRSASTGRVQKCKQTSTASTAIALADGIDTNLLHPDFRARSPILTRNATKTAQQQSGEGTSSGTSSNPIPTSNQFGLLSDEDIEIDDDDDGKSSKSGDLEPTKPKLEQNKKQPAIHIPSTPWEKVVKLMNRNDCEYATKICKSSVQIHTLSRTMFEKVQSVLKAGSVEFFTYDSPLSKPVKIVLSGYMSEPTADLIKDLADYNINPREAKILSKKQTVTGEHALYLLYFDRGSFKIQDLRRIKNVYGYLVNWRYYAKRPNGAAQCHRCQRFGHGSRNGTLSPKCVKCGENHLTEDCTLPRKSSLKEDNAQQHKPLLKCINCKGNHTANYRGCPTRKAYLEEIEKRKKKPSSRSILKSTVPASKLQVPTPSSTPAQPPGWGRSFASVVAAADDTAAAPDAAANGNLFTVTEFLCLARDMFERLSGCRNKQQQFLALGELMMKYIGN